MMVEATPLEGLVPAATTAERTPGTQPVGWLGQLGWALYDAGRSPYNVLVNIFIFSAYFTSTVMTDPVQGQIEWSYITAIAAVMLALGGPVLGAIADAGGRRKPWLAACTILGAPCMCLLWFATPGMTEGIGLVIFAVVGGNLSFEFSAIFCNAMLPNVAPPGRVGFLSGLGLAIGNLAGIMLFVFFLAAWSWNPHPLFGLDPAMHEPERAVGMLGAFWFVLCSIPLFFVTPDSPGTSKSIPEAVRSGIVNLIDTVQKLGRYRNILTYLLARMAFNEGFICLMVFTGVFAAGILHWNATTLVAEGLVNSVVAALGAFIGGWVDSRFGPKRSVMLFVAGCLIGNLILTSITPEMIFFIPLHDQVPTAGLFPTLPDKVFLADQAFIAFTVTGGLVSSRSLMAQIAPREMLNEFFGLYALSGTATAFIGPSAIGVLTGVFHSQRAGVAVGVVFLAVGLVVTSFVKVVRAVKQH